jgi:PAS domain S-box-containing protein
MNIPVTEKKKINILIIDDDEDDFFILKKYISRISNIDAFVIEWCGGYAEGVEAICYGKHDIYFVDFRLGPKTGLDLIKEVIKNKCEQPLILLTGAGNQEIDLQAMQAGAADYLVKSELTTEKLERCIRYAVSRHQFLNALKASEQKYRGIFEKSKDCIFIANEELVFTEVNEEGSRLLGYNYDEILQMHLYDLLADNNDTITIKQGLLKTGEIVDKEVSLLTKNRQILNTILSVSKEKDGNGRVYFQGVIHDITVLKNAGKASIQTAKLKATERLVRTLAHEVRNPLNNIILSLDQFEPQKYEEEKVYIDIIDRNSKRINTLISELLNASRPPVIALQEVSLQSILEKSIGSAMDRIVLKKIDLQQDYCQNDALIMADPDKLSIAFLNIIINGVEAAPANDALLQVQLRDERDSYIVSITDNGYGINDENLSQLFEPYYTTKAGGMGLGLSSALSIFESHRAVVEVKSAINSGTSFFMIFKK